MIVDFNDLESDGNLTADLCVIGAGAAGITIAREFFGTSTEVLMLEGGGLVAECETTELNRVEQIGRELPGAWDGRARIFGGTTTLWGGQAVALEASDFEHRPWVPYSGWPIGRDALDDYYPRALEVLELDEELWDEQYWRTRGLEPPGFDPDQLGILFSKINRVVFEDRGLGVHDFARRYRGQLEAAPNVRVLTHAHASCLCANEDGTAIEHAEILSLRGHGAKVRAKAYVVCCGGIDSARLLLLSDDVVANGLGNRNDLVGRFFQEHPIWECGVIHTEDPSYLQERFIMNFESRTVRWARIMLGRKVQRRLETLNCYANILFDWHPESGIQAAMELYKGWLGKRRPQEPWRNFWRCIKRPHEPIRHGIPYFLRGTWPQPRPHEIRLRCHVEQLPDPESRVTLSEARDALGLRRARLDWRLHEVERRTVLALSRTIDSEFRRLGLGRVQLKDWVTQEGDGWKDHIREARHHGGTTRMSDSPSHGVVDSKCRVHGISNLWVNSNSAFPTSGTANPTLTIMALGIRLCDQLKAKI